MFEGFNLVIRNWHYVGLPENPVLRYFGYAWSFATIWPAIFIGAELIAVARKKSGGSRGSGRLVRSELRGSSGSREPLNSNPTNPPDVRDPRDSRALPSRAATLSIAAGVAMLAAPFLVSRELARYLAAPVWLGFIFLLDPINARLGAESLWADWRAGRRDRLINLVLSGFLCGVLWEFWNYWSRAKWIYSVPIMERLKIFEMPLPGYFGFPAFALECFTLYVFLRRLVTFGGRPIAL